MFTSKEEAIMLMKERTRKIPVVKNPRKKVLVTVVPGE
jgi:hypothetical protein